MKRIENDKIIKFNYSLDFPVRQMDRGLLEPVVLTRDRCSLTRNLTFVREPERG